MKLRSLVDTTLLLMAAFIVPGAAQGPSFESENTADLGDTTLRSFRVQVRSLFEKRAYAELDSLASQLRVQKLRFNGGMWRLGVFYMAVGSAPPSGEYDQEWQARIAKLEEWIRSNPTSLTPRVALGQAYIAYAWRARGNGYANTVTAEGGKLFRERIESARTTLEEAAKTVGRDAAWYREMQIVALAQGWDRARMDALTEEALKSEPGYSAVAIAEANYLLPKWHGKPGDTERFAEQTADRIGGAEGDAMYFVIASAMNCCQATQAPGLSWERAKRGFAALEQLYGASNYLVNAMAYLALRAGDNETAQQMFARIGMDWNQRVWRSKARFDASRTGQKLGGTPPVAGGAR